jgi:predicted ATPase
MKISLENLGNISKSEYELGDLTIICGNNNTSKTYAMYALYGFLSQAGGTQKFNNQLTISLPTYTIESQKRVWNDIADASSDTWYLDFKNICLLINDIDFETFLSAMKQDGTYNIYLNDNFYKLLLQYEQWINLEYNKCILQIGKENASNYQFYYSWVNYLQNHPAILQHWNYDAKFSGTFNNKIKISKNCNSNYFQFSFIGKIVDCDIYTQTTAQGELSMQYYYYICVRNICISIFSYILDAFISNVHILTAERSGIAMFDHHLNLQTNQLLREFYTDAAQQKRYDIIDKVAQTLGQNYDKPVQANIEFLGNMQQIIGNNPNGYLMQKYPEIISFFETISQGKYIYDQYYGITFVPDTDDNIQASLHLSLGKSSSSIRSLVHLNFYLKHIAQKGDLLMIDEPELNLHPHNQRKMAILIVMLINAGIKVMLTTHSNFFINEISNLIMLTESYKDKEYNSQVLNDIRVKYVQKNINKLEDNTDLSTENIQNILNTIKLSADSVKVYNAKMKTAGVEFEPVSVTKDGIDKVGFEQDIADSSSIYTQIIQGRYY